MKKTSNLILAGIAVAAMAAGLWLGQYEGERQAQLKPPSIQGAIYPIAKSISPFKLMNHTESMVSNQGLFGKKWSLLFVGYTHCPDICPTTLSVMNQVDQYMKEQSLAPPQFIFISIDPERDKPDALKQYVEYFNQDFVGLTGELDQINQLSRELNAVFQKAPGSSGKITVDDYLMDHSSALMLVNPEGKLQSILTAPHLPGTVIESIIQSQEYYKASI